MRKCVNCGERGVSSDDLCAECWLNHYTEEASDRYRGDGL